MANDIAYCLLFRIFVQNISMAIPSFFKQNKPRGFNYAPRHYDPVKEEREARHRAMGLVQDEEGGVRSEERGEKKPLQETFRRTIMRGSMRGYFRHGTERTQKHNSIKLIVIILILVLVAYLYLRF
ncbi:MAG TPA: hypothetical protein VMV74_12305 [Bacteroidales bacterium]|nr:hypothetical protein [Bacteroidales bacterium]